MLDPVHLIILTVQLCLCGNNGFYLTLRAFAFFITNAGKRTSQVSSEANKRVVNYDIFRSLCCFLNQTKNDKENKS